MIKIWHLIVVILASPYFFYWITPDKAGALGVINICVCLAILGVCCFLIADKDLLKQINENLNNEL